MKITAQDIYYLSHAYKNVCDAKCEVPSCIEESVNALIINNLIQSNLQYAKQLECGDTSNHGSTL